MMRGMLCHAHPDHYAGVRPHQIPRNHWRGCIQDKHEHSADCPQIPWTEIIAMRNRLIHDYFDIDLDRVRDAVNEDLPSLAAELKKLIQQGKY